MSTRQREKAPDLCRECGASWDCEHSQRKPEKPRPTPIVKELTALAEAADKTAAQTAKRLTWREYADQILARVFNGGDHEPSPKEIFDAYPFGMRKYHPYKVWLKQVAWWKAGCPDKRRRPVSEPLPGQGALL